MDSLRNEDCDFVTASAMGVEIYLLLLDKAVAIFTVLSCRKVAKV